MTALILLVSGPSIAWQRSGHSSSGRRRGLDLEWAARGGSSVGRARASQARGRGFETRPPLRSSVRGYSPPMGLITGITSRVARRSRWLAERLWFIAVAEVAWTSWGHWRRLEPRERDRLVHLARKSRGTPTKPLTAAERREAGELLDKLGHIELGGSIARTVLPFRPLSSSAEWYLRRRHKRSVRRRGDPTEVAPTST